MKPQAGSVHTAPGGGAADELPRDVGRRTIACEIAGLQRLSEGLDESFDAAAKVLIELTGKAITLGIGKSGHAAQKVAATLRSVGVPALYLNASDSLHGDLGVVGPGDVALMFSKSGATRELTAIVPHLRSRGVTMVAITAVVSSPLARDSSIVLDASVEREGCPLDVAPMASIVAAQAVGDALAAAVSEARGFTVDDFARLHSGGTLGACLTLLVDDVMRRGEELPAVSVHASLKDAIFEITRTGWGAACVVDADGRLEGFVTDGDIRRKLLETEDLTGIAVAEVMTPDPLTVTPDLPLSQALLQLEQRKKAFLAAPVVVDGHRCVGLLRLHDAVQAHLPT